MSGLADNGKAIRVGCIGGGQLGRMMALEAPRLNISMSFLDPLGEGCPAALASSSSGNSRIIQGKLNDVEKVKELAEGCDVLTVEIEHVSVEGMALIESDADCQVKVYPSSRVVRLIQDKFLQKEHFKSCKIPIPPYTAIPNVSSIHTAASELGLPLMLKSRKGAYDGRGNAVLKDTTPESIDAALQSLGCPNSGQELDLYAEGWIHFDMEVAVMVVRSSSATSTTASTTSTTTDTTTHAHIRCYPAVTAIQTNSICRIVLAPARGLPNEEIRQRCQQVAMEAVHQLGEGACGVFGVELFLVKKRTPCDSNMEGGWDVLVNEVAPRPHNTGHYTQDACAVSQFENHLRAITGMPLGDVELAVGASAMVNVLGAPSGVMSDTLQSINLALTLPRSTVHWYGKEQCRAGRKMGHVNITGDSHAEMEDTLLQLLACEGIDKDVLSVTNDTFYISKKTKAPQQSPPLVGVIMGSSSDLPTMQQAVSILRETFEIPTEVDIVSAHRTPHKLVSYAQSAASRGLQVIIAGAGGAAHLPGMVASLTPLPVIGVPIKTSTMNGQDSLYSIVQMPRGIPVATVAIGNATNAGLLAVRMLAGSRAGLRRRMETYQMEMRQKVEDTSEELREMGSERFLDGMEEKNTSVNV